MINFKKRYRKLFNIILSQVSNPEETQGTDTTSKQKRMKWTYEVNNVLPGCKQKARDNERPCRTAIRIGAEVDAESDPVTQF